MELYDKKINGMTFQCSKRLEELGVKHGFSTRMGGVSTGVYESLNIGLNRGDDDSLVRENYERILDALDMKENLFLNANQKHTNIVKAVNESDAKGDIFNPVPYDLDGYVTNTKNMTLVMYSADCLTAIFYDPVKQVIGNVHAGWRGSVNGIVANAIKEMIDNYGCKPKDIVVALGPCIDKCCFETDWDVPEEMIRIMGEDANNFFTKVPSGKYMVDLKSLNIAILEKAGVSRDNIDVSSECTMCNPKKYWSHRVTKGIRGSQGSFISM